MKMYALYFTLGLLALSTAACDSGISPEATTPAILPLDDGNTWIGEYTIRDSAGMILRRGIDTTRLDGGRVFGADRFGLLTDHRFVSNRDGGLIVGANDGDQWLYMKYPATRGDRVIHSNGEDSGRSVTVDVISNDETITVDAGTFRTYHYKTHETNNAYTVSAHLAPGVGFVRIEIRDRPGDRWNLGSMIWVLQEVRLSR